MPTDKYTSKILLQGNKLDFNFFLEQDKSPEEQSTFSVVGTFMMYRIKSQLTE